MEQLQSNVSTPHAPASDGDDKFHTWCFEHYLYWIGGSVVNALSLTGCSILYGKLASHLNDRENWRTETEHRDALILKMMLFESLNNFFLCFYIAFFKSGTLFGEPNTCVLQANPHIDAAENPAACRMVDQDGVCLVPDCMLELELQLAVVFLLKTTGKQIVEFMRANVWCKRM